MEGAVRKKNFDSLAFKNICINNNSNNSPFIIKQSENREEEKDMVVLKNGKQAVNIIEENVNTSCFGTSIWKTYCDRIIFIWNNPNSK